MKGCAFCTNDTECVSCMSGYYLNSSTSLCDYCTDLFGCLICKDETDCLYCDTSYYLDTTSGLGVCASCVLAIPGCYTCSSALVCTSCLGSYTLTNTSSCQYLAIEAADLSVDELILKTFYQSDTVLRHEIYVIGMTFTRISLTLVQWQDELKLTIQDADGTAVDLLILAVDWGNNYYTLIVYTDNPINIDRSSLTMPFARRRLQGHT